MKLRIVNIKNYIYKDNEILIMVDRRSALGNPFVMNHESQRDYVCEKYEKWFNIQMDDINSDASKMIYDIIEKNKNNNIALGCWCVPKRCHAETIIKYILKTKGE